MRNLLLVPAFALLSATAAVGAGSHSGGHGSSGSDSHGMMVGAPGSPSDVTRTIRVEMLETEDGRMIFKPDNLAFKRGETIRFSIVNKGELEHEFVLDEMARNAEHKELMQKFPEMEHDDPNSVRLEPGETGEIIWTFTNDGGFEFACLVPGHYESGMHGKVSVAAPAN
ncbi:cupredoxin family protein [Microbaculum marinum]|uniref:Cupredoxin family protein n=1 Tax=Microbaculum marinum TaxID=1764581 RepID=A0AAW9RQI8_9HYPH